jgi:hypothetical protein
MRIDQIWLVNRVIDQSKRHPFLCDTLKMQAILPLDAGGVLEGHLRNAFDVH